MSYRKKMSYQGSRKNFRRNNVSKKINHIPRLGSRGGIRL